MVVADLWIVVVWQWRLVLWFFFFFSNSVFFSGSGGDGFGGLLVVVVIAGHGYNGERRREKCEVYIILLFDSWFILF